MSGIAGIDTLVLKEVSIPKIGIARRYRKVMIPGPGIEQGYRKVLIPKLVLLYLIFLPFYL